MGRFVRTLACCLALAALPPAPARADDWLEFRGPDGTGHYTGRKLPEEWGPDKNVVWKAEIPGAGWSSPISLRNVLYLTSAVKTGDTGYDLVALAVDGKDGKVLWQTTLFHEAADAPKPHGKNSHASPTPVSDGKTVFVHFGHMGTAALDLKGKVLWKNDENKYQPTHGNGGSPILAGGNLLVACDGKDQQFVLAIDAATGRNAWKTPRDHGAKMAFSFATSQVIKHEGIEQVVSPASDFVMSYDPKTGRELWRVKYPKSGWSLICRPVYAHGMVFVLTGYPTASLLAIKPEGTGDITNSAVVWQTNQKTANTPTPLVVGDELYMLADSGVLTSLDAKTGKVHFSERLPGGGGYSSSPIYADGKLWITNETGAGCVVRTGKAFEVVSKSDMKEKTFATFVPVDGRLYLRTETKLFCFADPVN